MNPYLLSFLSEFESSLQADDPAPSDGGSWESSRMVNYAQGLARLALAVRLPAGDSESRGIVALQSYSLADGSNCLKAVLSWTGQTENLTCTIYSKPGVDWKREARKAAAEWMAGPRLPAVASEQEAAGELVGAAAAFAG